MSIQEVGRSGKSGKEQIQEYPGRKRKERTRKFQDSLMQNLKYQEQTQEQDNREKTGNGAGRIGRDSRDSSGIDIQKNGQNSGEKALSGTYRLEETARAGRLGAPGMRVNTLAGLETVQAAEVRHMSYEESDNIEIAVTEGYTLKGKLEGRCVYVEAKYDDGRLEAYQVDTDRVQEQTQHRIERFAVETAASMADSERTEGKDIG